MVNHISKLERMYAARVAEYSRQSMTLGNDNESPGRWVNTALGWEQVIDNLREPNFDSVLTRDPITTISRSMSFTNLDDSFIGNCVYQLNTQDQVQGSKSHVNEAEHNSGKTNAAYLFPKDLLFKGKAKIDLISTDLVKSDSLRNTSNNISEIISSIQEDMEINHKLDTEVSLFSASLPSLSATEIENRESASQMRTLIRRTDLLDADNPLHSNAKASGANYSWKNRHPLCMSPEKGRSRYFVPSSDSTLEVKYFGHQRVLVKTDRKW